MRKTTKTLVLLALFGLFSVCPAQAQTSQQRITHRQLVQNAKNFIVTLTNSKTYYYIVSSEQSALIEFNGDQVRINGDEMAWRNIKSMRVTDMPRFFFDEDSTTYAGSYAIDHGMVALHHSMKKGQWNTFVVPFALTCEQITSTFGEGTQLAKLKAVRENDNTTIEFETLDLNTTDPVTTANFCYLIRPTGDPDFTEDQRMTLISGIRPYGPIYLFAGVSVKKSQNPRVNSASSSDGTTKIRMRGTYAMLDNSVVSGVAIKNKKIAPGTYSLNEDGLFAENQDSTIVKAFHAWIDNIGETKTLKFYVNGAEEDITALADAIQLPEAVLSREYADVYDVQGRCVGHLNAGATIGSLNLPRGIYILRGRKYVIQ
jgi:hypothetical protein